MSTPIFCDALVDDVLQNIHNRETLIERLEKLHRESVVSRDNRIQRLLYGIHNASIAVVEAITAWNQCKQQAWHRKKTIEMHDAALNSSSTENKLCSERCPFNTFLWNGQHYMRKMLVDMDFVGDIPEAVQFLGPATSFYRNPFLLSLNADDLTAIRRESLDAKTTLSIPWKDVNLQRVQRASFILLLDEFHRELDLSSSVAPSINGRESVLASYATYRCRDEKHSIKFYPPEMKMGDLAMFEDMIDPPVLPVIAISCASLVLNCVDSDITNKLIFLTKPIALKIFRHPIASLIERARSFNPLQTIDSKIMNIVYPFVMHEHIDKYCLERHNSDPLVLLIDWLRGVLVRSFNGEMTSNTSFSVEKVFSELNIDYQRRKNNAKKSNCFMANDFDKENEAVVSTRRNVSIQVQTDDIDKEVTKDSSCHELQAINDFLDTEPIKLVPIPIAITADVTEGSQTAFVNGDIESASNIKPGDCLRIYDPFESSDWKVIVAPKLDETGKIIFELASAYDHSRIVAQEKKTRDDAIYRLCYGKDRVPSPDRVLLSIQTNERHDVASDHHSSTRSHLRVKEARVWKLIPEDEDSRPPWRKEYDDQAVPWTEEYADSNKHTNIFRIRIKMKTIEINCRDSPYRHGLHQQRVKFFEHVSLNKVVDEAFHAVCRWHPKGNLVDNVKWAKLSRKMKFMSNIKNAKHEIDMAFVRHNHDRKLDINRFHEILKDIASMQFPALPIDVRSLSLTNLIFFDPAIVIELNNFFFLDCSSQGCLVITGDVT